MQKPEDLFQRYIWLVNTFRETFVGMEDDMIDAAKVIDRLHDVIHPYGLVGFCFLVNTKSRPPNNHRNGSLIGPKTRWNQESKNKRVDDRVYQEEENFGEFTLIMTNFWKNK